MLESFKLEGKVAIVTGASRGLGQGMAVGLAEAGATIIALSTNKDNLLETIKLVEQTGQQCIGMTCDVTDKENTKKAIENTLAKFGKIDILVNNAGTIRRSPAEKYSDEDWLTVLDTNLNSLFRLSREVGAEMIKQSSGKIINIASLLSFQGGITVPAYAASKGGVMQLTKALANEWAKHNIQVNAIAPGYFATDNTAALRENPERNRQINERIPAGKWGVPDDLKGTVVYLASKASDYVNGHILLVDGGWMAR
ncbi:MAG: 2-dehydro-3-deoxy-D-gluconate 5-dehydrogenase KduD [Calditrichaeota bacterium]|nr:2-dehydro-3-deoxy-D-gluconate 5-dehydrogenase KduD [Calditrichota bacterium]